MYNKYQNFEKGKLRRSELQRTKTAVRSTLFTIHYFVSKF